jgi:dihydrodipicolinate synthase/N-acetylneuraminate lyase
MVPPFVRGPIANVFTCFNEDLSIDPNGQRAFLDFLAQSNSVSAYFVRSGMGQMYAYDAEDTRIMAKLACDHLRGKAPVLVGSAGIWDHNYDRRPDPTVFTREAVELSKFAEQQGAAGVVHTLPEAIVPAAGVTIADVTLRYFEAVCSAVKIPVFMYQPPVTAKEYRVTVDSLPRLGELPNAAAIKVSTTDVEYLLDLTWSIRDKDFAMIPGSECAYYSALGMGLKGVIGQGCCVNPSILLEELLRFERGDLEGAMDAQRSVNYLVQTSVCTVEFLKRYAAEKGFPVKPFARPMLNNPYFTDPKPITEQQYTAYKQILETELEKYSRVGANAN